MLKKVLNKYNSFPRQAKAAFWFLICSFLQKGISMLTTPIFTRLLSEAEFGQFGVFNSWLGIITVFVSLNLGAGVFTQGLVKFDQERKIFTSSLQGLTVLSTSVWTVVYLIFRDKWNELFSLTTTQMLAMLIMIWATAVFNFWAAEQRVLLNYKALVAVTLIASIAKPTVGIILVKLSDDKVTARIIGLLLVELVVYAWMFVVHVARGKKLYSGKFWKYALLFNLPLIPHYLSQTVLNSSDKIMIEKLVGLEESGIYGLAYSVSQIMTLFNTALVQTINPWLYQKIKERDLGKLPGIAYISLTLIASVNLFLIALAPEAVQIFGGSAYYDAIWVIPPVAMSVFFMFCYSLFAAFEFYYKKTFGVAVATIAGAALNVLLNYIFIPIFGYYAAGYTTLFCYIVYAAAHYVFMSRICKQEGFAKVYDLRFLLGISVIFIAAGFALMLTYRILWLRLLVVFISVVICILIRKRIVKIFKTFTQMKSKK